MQTVTHPTLLLAIDGVPILDTDRPYHGSETIVALPAEPATAGDWSTVQMRHVELRHKLISRVLGDTLHRAVYVDIDDHTGDLRGWVVKHFAGLPPAWLSPLWVTTMKLAHKKANA